MSEGPEWVEKDAFVMPELPATLKVDPLLAALLHMAAFLELSGDELVDPDWAVEAMEHVGYYLQRLPADRFEAIRSQTAKVARHARNGKWPPDAVEFLEQFMENFGVGEADE
jgi:hypothetical protein